MYTTQRKTKMSDPYKTMMEDPCDDIIMQELITYRTKPDGTTVRTTTTRRFYKGDYIDSQTNVPLRTA
jgi:hypothetical protein